jgi:nucleotide-binding universal stress UspA family protein
VLAGIDGGPTSQAVLRFALDYASRHRQQVSVVMCLPRLARRPDTTDLSAIEDAERWLAEATARWEARYPDTTITPTVLPDRPIEGLVRAAQHRRLLVVGMHRSHRRLGAVATGVLHHTPCPVAAVPVRSRLD